jgi:hypothetical protein
MERSRTIGLVGQVFNSVGAPEDVEEIVDVLKRDCFVQRDSDISVIEVPQIDLLLVGPACTSSMVLFGLMRNVSKNSSFVTVLPS